MLHAKLLRSPHAHARVKSIDTARAAKLPGVRAIATIEEVPKVIEYWFFLRTDKKRKQMFLRDNILRFFGDLCWRSPPKRRRSPRRLSLSSEPDV